ncbi:DUF7549 family protein [Natronomonas sp. EA1]|uniref:DUF7549 family protein n=1 Tax=Natronomonas sp. EA1 TaxID=3421655 RepID=UPI003EC0EC33
MVWVRKEYAGELAVLSVWVSVLIPWSVSYVTREGISLVVIRFPFFLFQFIFGADLGALERPFLTVNRAPAFESGAVSQAYEVWLAAAVVFGLAFLLSVAYYALDERLETRFTAVHRALDPVRLLGGLLVVSGGLLLASAVMLVDAYAGLSVPLGAFFLLAFGGVLLRVERT